MYVLFEIYINVEIVGCYNRRHRRGANSILGSGQGLKAKSRRGSQDSDDVDDDSLAAELLVSTVKNLRSLCEIMLDGIRYRITKLDTSNLVVNLRYNTFKLKYDEIFILQIFTTNLVRKMIAQQAMRIPTLKFPLVRNQPLQFYQLELEGSVF